MQVVDEPSIGLMYLRIRELIEPRIRWWLLHSARRGEPIDVGRTTAHN